MSRPRARAVSAVTATPRALAYGISIVVDARTPGSSAPQRAQQFIGNPQEIQARQPEQKADHKKEGMKGHFCQIMIGPQVQLFPLKCSIIFLKWDPSQ